MMNARILTLPWLVLFASQVSAATTHVVVRTVEEISAQQPVKVNGVVTSRDDLLLSASRDGELRFVAREGTRVHKGMVLARVDAEALKLRIREQKLLTERARINVAYLGAEADRLTRLERQNLAAQTQLAEIVSRRDLARNDLAVSQARVAQLEEELARTRIVSPVDGVVVARVKQAGEFAGRGEEVLRILNNGDLEIRTAVPVAWFDHVEEGGKALISTAGIEFEGHVRAILNMSDERSQTFDILVSVPGDVAAKLVPGQFAEVSVPITDPRRSLFVPRDAVVLRGDGNYVFRIDERNRAERVNVVLGRGQGDLVAVSGNLRDGDRVAIRGVERLEDGQEVIPTMPATAAESPG